MRPRHRRGGASAAGVADGGGEARARLAGRQDGVLRRLRRQGGGAHAARSRGRARRPTSSDGGGKPRRNLASRRSEEHTSELQSLMRISYAVFCLKKKKNNQYTKITQR